MREQPNIKKNFAYSFAYQLLTVVLPLITAPYIARTLGPDPIGVFQKTYAAAYYFYLFTLLGLKNYGNRTIARVREDPAARSRAFCELYALQLGVSVIVAALYVGFCFRFTEEYRVIYLLQGFYVLSGMLETDWFCYGMEQFKLPMLRCTAMRLGVLAAVFVFVHEPKDLGVYTAILSVGTLLSELMLWPYILKEIKPVRPTWKGIVQHIKPNLMLFWPVVAVSLYNLMDKLLLGCFGTNEEVAFYANAEKINNIAVTLILALDAVVMPRMSNIFAKNDTEQAKKLMDTVMLFAMFLSSALAFGLAGIAEGFAPWFYGAAFVRCGFYMLLLSPTVLIKGWASALRTQYIIPTGKDRIFLISLSAGAGVNLILDLLLIPSLAGVGAIIGTIAAEATVAILQFVLCRKDVPLGSYLKDGAAFVLIGAIMFAAVKAVGLLPLHPAAMFVLQVITGVLVYIPFACVYMLKIAKKPMLINEALSILKVKHRFGMGKDA